MIPLTERLVEQADIWPTVWPTALAIFSLVALLIALSMVRSG